MFGSQDRLIRLVKIPQSIVVISGEALHSYWSQDRRCGCQDRTIPGPVHIAGSALFHNCAYPVRLEWNIYRTSQERRKTGLVSNSRGLVNPLGW